MNRSGAVVVGATHVPNAIAENGEAEVQSNIDDSSLALSNLYNPEGKDAQKEIRMRIVQTTEYVRHSLFPYWKFFSHQNQLVYNSSRDSIVQKIIRDLNVSKKFEQTWWGMNKDHISKLLCMKRNDVTSYMKKKFLGTLHLQFSFVVVTSSNPFSC